MKTCAICTKTNADEDPTCSACGEGSFIGADVAVAKAAEEAALMAELEAEQAAKADAGDTAQTPARKGRR